MPICEIIRDLCRELESGERRDPIEYHEAFGKGAKAAKEVGDPETAARCRLLAAVFSMRLKRGADGPFAPLVVWPDGSRSLLPKDLTPADIAELEKLIECSADPVFVARIADVLWIVSKKHEYARRAFRAYMESADGETDSWVPKQEWLARATDLAMALGKKAPERTEATAKIEQLFERSKADCFTPNRDIWPATLAGILIESRLASDWQKLGDDCMAIAAGFPIVPGCDEPRRYYELASQAYNLAGLPAKAQEARLSIAKHWEAEAGAFKTAGGDSFNIAHRIEQAIEAYRRAGGEREKVEVLMGDLKQANKKMITEMKSVSVPMDVEPLVTAAERAIAGRVGMPSILAFEGLYSPSPYEEIRQGALSQSHASPLTALIGAKIVVSEGNIAANIPGMLENEAAKIHAMVVQGYNMRQNIAGATALEVGRRMIQEGADGSWKDAIRELVQGSKLVPEDRREIFERALGAGFAGDRLVFAHLVIPQIENSLRHVFGDAGLPITSMNAEGVQEERDLNRLLTDEAAKTVLSEGLVWEMRSFLIEKTGPNLRNRLCHGLLGSGDFDRPAMNLLLWLTVSLLLRYVGSGAS